MNVEFQNILLPTDFGDAAARAADLAVSLARTCDGTITLLHVYELPPVYGYGEALAWPTGDFAREAQRSLDAAVVRLKERYPRVQGLLETGRPSERIAAVVEARKPDLVVMGTHGRRGLAHAFLGSVAEKVVRRSVVPVLTVGPHASVPTPA